MATDSIASRFKRAWNAFTNRPSYNPYDYGTSFRPDRLKIANGNERTIINAVCNRIAMDIAALTFQHVRLDENGRYMETIYSDLNNCLTVEANVDQTARDMFQNVVLAMMHDGCVAVVPVDCDVDPNLTSSFDVRSMRVGKITEWKPEDVKVQLYDARDGKKKEIWVKKKYTAILQNPFYTVMNERNSTMQRLIRKISLLDQIDEHNSAGRLDLIIQLPYVVKNEARRAQAEARRKDIEMQLNGSKYGIAYTDGTEKIVQLNKPIENQLTQQVEYLTSQLWSQLGMSQGILDGTADEKTMLNYYNRVVEYFASTITDEYIRKFLTKTGRTKGQSIMFFRDPFKLVSCEELAELADKLTRNEIMTSNEIRQVIGIKPSDDPAADELRNKNLNQEAPMEPEDPYGYNEYYEEGE